MIKSERRNGCWFPESLRSSHISKGAADRKPQPLQSTFLHIFLTSSFFSSKPFICFLIYFFIEVQLIYNVVLVSGAQQSDSVIHIYLFFFRFFSIIGYYRILNIVPCAI